MNESNQDRNPPAFWILALIVLVVVIAYLAISTWLLPNIEVRGQFGDSFGAVNALFSGLAFAGLISALFLQRSELQLQRDELRLTRNELAAQSAAQKEQANTALKAAAINALAALLPLHIKRLDALSPSPAKGQQDQKVRQLEAQLEALLNEVAP